MGPVVTWPDQTLWNTNVRHGCQVKRVTALWAGSSRILGQFSLLRYRPHPWKSCSKRPDSISINSRGESRARIFKGSYVNSMWCEKTFSPAHAEESYTSSDYSASPANLVVQWKKEVKKKRIAWSNECAAWEEMTLITTGAHWEILPTDLVGTIWNGKLIAWHIWGTPCIKNQEREIFRSFTCIFSVNELCKIVF